MKPSDPYDPTVYSNVSQGHKRFTWKELYMESLDELEKLHLFRRIVLDLDRNAGGRHEGDSDVADPRGISQGNPNLKTGGILGYNIRGGAYIMPERGKRHDPKEWGAR